MSGRGPRDPSIELPRLLGRYELALELASGGFGSVYLARVVGPGAYEKFVALKLIHPHLSRHEGFVTMFLDEARVASSINHPNVCSAVDFGEVDGVLFLAMDFLVGEPLTRVKAALTASAPTHTPEERHAFAARVVADSAEGLHAAHESLGPDGLPLGIVHRDVSPPNLFVRYDGSVQVMDFGVAKAAGQMHVTAEGMAKGHVAYVAPEQLKRQPFDRRVDVWSLGVVLWELVTNRRLFARESIESTLFAIARDEAPRPSSVEPSVPPELESIIMRALAKDPAQRWSTAREMSDELLWFVHQSQVPMGPGRVSDWMERLFPDGRLRKLQLFDRARHVLGPARRDETPHRIVRRISSRPPAATDDTGPNIPPPPLVPSDIQVEVEIEPEQPAAMDGSAAPPSEVGPGPGAAAPGGPARGGARRPGTVFILGALGVGVLAVGLATMASGMWSADGEEPRSPEHTDREPSQDEMAPGALLSVAEPGGIEPAGLSAPADAVPADAGTSADAAADAGEGAADDTPSARPQTTGFVNVVTPGGWADVRHEGTSYGPTPVRLTLPSGRRRIELVPSGSGPARVVEVEVEVGRVVRVVVPLRAGTADAP